MKIKLLKTVLIVLLLIILCVGGVLGFKYIIPYITADKTPAKSASPNTQGLVPKDTQDNEQPVTVEYEVELVTQDLYVPWSIVFTSPTRFIFTERIGSIREYNNGTLNPQPLITFTDISTIEEEGLMGLALDPDYNSNKFVYASYAYPKDGKLFVKVEKLKDEDNKITSVGVVLDKIPAAKYHAGSRIKFGPDKKLYVTTGDATDKNSAQDLNALSGKILRIETNGSAPSDNPFRNSLVYSYGHRNPQGIDWHPETGMLIATEHGPSVNDGPPGGDEINLIKPGNNYGWPIISHDRNKFGMESPLTQYTPAIAPASGTFYNSNVFPQFKNVYFFGGLRGEGIYWVTIDKVGRVTDRGKLPDINYGRVREITVSPNGEIYFSTSNQDGRGTLRSNDDKIYKIKPKI